MIDQKKAVYSAIVDAYRNNDRHFEDYKVQVNLSTVERKTVIHLISQGLQNGTISITESAKDRYNTPKKMYNYATGLVSDRLRKDKRFNCGEPYQPKKPGSRAGAGDSVIKELREYKRRHCTTAEEKLEADRAIDARLNEIKAESLSKSGVDMDIVNKYVKA